MIELLKKNLPLLLLILIVLLLSNGLTYFASHKSNQMTKRQYEDSIKVIDLKLKETKALFVIEAHLRKMDNIEDSILVVKLTSLSKQDQVLIKAQKAALNQFKGRTNHSLLTALDSAYEANHP